MNKYVIVTPVKNEEKFIRKTLDSIISQELLPLKWVIVDDGSTDSTLKILQEYEKLFPWIKIISNHTFNEVRSGGSKVVKAFYKGYPLVENLDYDFIVKLDGDLELPINYFKLISECFKTNPKVGMCGGYILNKINESLIPEPYSEYHVRGAFKAIHKKCFSDIGGFKPIWNWDSVDEMDAMVQGWETKVLDIPVIHFRPTSGAYNPYKQNYKDGYDAFCLRNSISLLLLRSIPRLFKKPIIIGAFCYVYGYFEALLKREKRIINIETSRFINHFHTTRILKSIFTLKR